MALPKVVTSAAEVYGLPRGQLLDIIETFQLEGEPANQNRWLMGVTWQPEPCRGLTTGDVEICSALDFPNNPNTFPDCETAITQTPFSVFDALKGSLPDTFPEDLERILRSRFLIKRSGAFGKELLSGAGSGDMALSKSAHAPTLRAFGTAVPIWLALAVIEDELARTLYGKGYIHISPGLLGQARATYGLMLNSQGVWETPLGNCIIADIGYVDAKEPVGQAASGTNSDWIYGSGPIRYRLTEPRMVDGDNIGSTITNFTGVVGSGQQPPAFGTRNVSKRFINSQGILIFDPCPVTAVLASYEQTDVV